MQTCDVIVVGGGPAGSTCARELVDRGARVTLLDRAPFPRDKVCAGWITPQVIRDVRLDVAEYAHDHVFQWLTDFRVAAEADDRAVLVHYGRPVSAAIRRCEFDHYLLQRSGAVIHTDTPARTIVRRSGGWVVDDRWMAPVVIGAGGWGCPVARLLNVGGDGSAPIIVAKEAEFVLPESGRKECAVPPGTAELTFTDDLLGYGWCVRKGDVMNVGIGRLGRRLPREEVERFAAFARTRRGVRVPEVDRWRGHAYLSGAARAVKRTGDGLLLVGDAAGLASARSGEGIGPAVESAILAASVVAAVRGPVTAEQLAIYDRLIAARWQQPSALERCAAVVPGALLRPLVTPLLRTRTFVEKIVLNQWFLHAQEISDRAA